LPDRLWHLETRCTSDRATPAVCWQLAGVRGPIRLGPNASAPGRGCQRKVAAGPEMRYYSQMQLPVDLTDAQLESLRDRAKSLGISPEQLASAAVADLVERPADDFARAASKVLSKNAELYRRLAR
jgi:hypothetical protein